jgi:hypothetical protein
MDENAVRDLLERIAQDEPPHNRVSVTQARRSGRRRLRLRTVYLPGAAAPVAAAVAVAVIAGLSAGVHGGRLPHQVSPPPAAPISAPSQFNPLAPYAAFGWLPKGYSVAGLANQSTQMTSQMTLTASSASGTAARRATDAVLGGPGQLLLTVYPAGWCHLGGPLTFKASPAKIKTKFGLRTHYPHGLDCRDDPAGEGLPVTGRAPDVNGQPTYWVASGGPGGRVLTWEYGRSAWALLDYEPAIKTSVTHPPSHAGQRRGSVPPASPATLAMVRKVASKVRFGVHSTVVYGFTLSGLPAAWQAGRVGSTYSVASVDGRAANVGWVAGPAVDPTALGISVWPAAQGSSPCKFVAGQSGYVRVDGARAMLRTIDEPGKHVQYLCAPDAHGLQFYLSLDLANPNTSDTPLPGSHTVGDLLKVFSHMRLLGPDVANWTTNPLR